ncbi:MAG: hypothetical protein JWM25_1344, partial [Thermoleophilia bacterium]|nr:hypothetical protein [Thermoleophilia bacterium]
GTQPATDRDYRRLGVGALLAFVIGTTTKLVVIAIQTGLLIYVAR